MLKFNFLKKCKTTSGWLMKVFWYVDRAENTSILTEDGEIIVLKTRGMNF
jgi:hypothetical protein